MISSITIITPKIREAIPLFVKKVRFIFDKSFGFIKRCWFIRRLMKIVVAVQNNIEAVKYFIPINRMNVAAMMCINLEKRKAFF